MKEMTDFSRFFYLYIIHKFKGERSVSGIFHLLKGKKTAQTIQDRTFYHLEPFFQSVEQLTLSRIKNHFDILMKEELIKEGDLEHFHLTNRGCQMFKKLKQSHNLPHGLEYTQYIMDERAFWVRLLLFVQVVSEWSYQSSRYIPVVSDPFIQQDIKSFLKQIPLKKEEITHRLHNELISSFHPLPNEYATCLVLQFSGHQVFGRTGKQLNQKYGLCDIEGFLFQKAVLRTWLNGIHSNQDRFPILNNLYRRIKKGIFTESTARTYELIKKGFSLVRIADIRKLKESTIEDHVTEIALYDPEFDIIPYVSREEQGLIWEAYIQVNSNKLREIKKHLPEKISYFQVRLVLANKAVDQ